ncbi:DUF5672 family protein [uncultured Draconibacterium sp.]|uniref:DUF5672 family protein n=1 Tax=uncultured Draconibacterium sp. TaxID=1573823 RepID=UPI003216F747
MVNADKKLTKKEIAVIIPVYKKCLENKEMEYFNHNCSILKDYPLFLVAPDDLALDNYLKETSLSVECFNAAFFENIAGYNRLLLSELFYTRFEKFKYILICQTDAFVFKDDLLTWCQKEYDYVGAPWINKPFFLFQYVLSKMGPVHALRMLLRNNLFKAVGNGGLSLRKVSTFINALNQERDSRRWKINEDFYWSFFATADDEFLKKPKAYDAGLFSIELSPRKLMKKQKGVLPFGIHAWEKIDSEYWETFIKRNLKEG